MIQTVRKAPNRAQEQRSQVGGYMGSHDTFQRLVGPLNGSVHKPKRTYGFCTAQARGCRGQSYARWRRAGDTAGDDGRVKATLSPPLPHPSDGGTPLNFSPLFYFFPTFLWIVLVFINF